jgi:transcriptional regulator with XRE-family HTH domain
MRSLGEAVGVTAQAIKRLEHDETMPSSKTFIALCKHLDVSAEWLMDTRPLDFHSTDTAPQGRHAKYWVREALAEMRAEGLIIHSEDPTP